MKTEKWIEDFYAEMEKIPGYKRPKDYIERAKRKTKRYPVRNQHEGRTGGNYHEE